MLHSYVFRGPRIKGHGRRRAPDLPAQQPGIPAGPVEGIQPVRRGRAGRPQQLQLLAGGHGAAHQSLLFQYLLVPVQVRHSHSQATPVMSWPGL